MNIMNPERAEAAPGPGTAGFFVGTAVVSALCWFALGAESVLNPGAADFRDALVLVPWLLLGATMVGVHLAQRHRSGLTGPAGLAGALSGTLLATAGNTGLILGSDTLLVLAFPVGPLLFSAGMLALGIATYRAGVLPRHAGVLIASSQPLMVGLGLALSPWVPLHPHGGYSGGLWHGVTMTAVALALVGAARRPSRD
ncbi:hypothetical protein Aph01nite_77130 [Acrocarpospora phusangensis]|uniref:Uncharacterized protein n=1 Tax=Acrocarpospora phusangensis TaxID=1070424 RepID=A0A919UT63_9ACTN|nr:hypothetical protein [Acrocarpospora phusangensis]GIH29403.1 hypothetical protein Aph01nite_77130 [Acrocarpospora phusangensis]